MNKVKIGIVGFGNIGLSHSKSLTSGKVPEMEMTAICDVLEERREMAKKLYPSVQVFDNAEALFSSGACDTVLISTRHYSHPELATQALAHGLNVLVEKPAGVYTLQVQEMNKAAEKSDKVFGIMFNQRTNALYQRLRDLVQSGELGHIKRITWIITTWYRPQAYHDSSTWRSTWGQEGGGALINQNPHQLDLWQWMFGVPDRVYARAGFGKYYNIEVEDDVMAYFEYDNGTTGEYITSTGETPGTNRLEVACDMGKVVVENDKITFYRNVMSEREFNKINTKPFGTLENWKCEIPVTVSKERQHEGIMRNFAAAVLRGEKLLAPGEEGIHGLTISNAIHLSAWTGEMVDLNNFPHERFYELLQEKVRNSTIVKEERNIIADTSGTY